MWSVVLLFALRAVVGTASIDPNIYFTYIPSADGPDAVGLRRGDYTEADGVTVAVPQNPRNGFYMININDLDSLFTPGAGNTVTYWSNPNEPFELYQKYESGQPIILGTYKSLVDSKYFYSYDYFSKGEVNEAQVLPRQQTQFSISSAATANSFRLVSNFIYTAYGITQNTNNRTNANEISGDAFYGTQTAFMGFYFYSKDNVYNINDFTSIYYTLQIESPSESTIPCFQNVRSKFDQTIKSMVLDNISTASVFCGAGEGYSQDFGVCETTGNSGSIKQFAFNLSQLDANIPPLEDLSSHGINSIPSDPSLPCLPWSVIRSGNVKYAMESLDYENVSQQAQNVFLHEAENAVIGCRNFKIGTSPASSMYCPVLYRPWQKFTVQWLLEPDDVLTYVDSTNNGTYYFWMARCFPEKERVADLYKESLRGTCATCPEGTYSNSNDASNFLCTTAPIGKYALSNHTDAAACLADSGLYADTNGLTACKSCTGALDNVSANALGEGVDCSSFSCPMGQRVKMGVGYSWELQNNTRPTQYSCILKPDQSSCIFLDFFDFPAAQKTCEEYTACNRLVTTWFNNGMYVMDEGNTSLVSDYNWTTYVLTRGLGCVNCTAGTFTDTTTQENCLPCDGDGARLVQNNSYNIGCECQEGYGAASSGVNTTCAKCEAPLYSSNLTSYTENCKKCEPPRLVTGNGTACSCANGYSGTGTSCFKCLAGTYADEAGLSACKPCQKGRFQSKNATSSCTACSKGTFSDRTGASACLKCAKGTATNSDTRLYHVFHPLHAEWETSYGDLKRCASCELGRYQDETGQAVCKACAEGKYLDETGSTASAACKGCAKGTFGSEVGLSNCDPCLPGTYSSGRAAQTCVLCGIGNYQDGSGKSTCKLCKAGTYADQTSLRRCKVCAASTYLNEEGATAGGDCKTCSGGTYSYVSGAKSCIVNVVNTYTSYDLFGREREPQFCSVTNYTDGAGTHAPYSGMVQCVQCQPGTFQDYGTATCDLCPVGSYQNEFGGTDCKACPSNQRGVRAGSYFCECGPGTYDVAKVDYPPQCERCTGQKYQDEIGMRDGCKECGDLYMPLPGHDECVPIIEEITDTCLMVFWVPECYKKGVHPITIALWLIVFAIVFYLGKYTFKETWRFIIEN